MHHDSDLAMARTLITGGEAVFDRFFNNYFPRLYRFAINRLESDEDAAKDVVQTTLINAIRAIATYRGEASMFTWLCQICRNEINGHYRRLARSVRVVPQDDEAIRPFLESLEAEEGGEPDAQFEHTEIKRLVQEVLDYLPSNYGNALEWKYIEGFSVAEIADRLELTELAAQSMLARARMAFRDALTLISPQLIPGHTGRGG